MKENQKLKITGTMLEKSQLEKHLEKIASSHNTTSKSQKDTYPVPQLIENFKTIEEVYSILNEHLKLGINIHPAGEWLLDNFYIIEETVKQIQKELPLNKYMNFVGISNGEYKGFARIYVLASEIVAYTDNKIDRENLEDYLISYQRKKTLSMDEIWNIGVFLQIAIIENITDICAQIYSSQIQKYRAENIAERLVENKDKSQTKFKNTKIEKEFFQDMRYPFIEYMSYILKRYGKKANAYLNVLEEVVEKLGTTVSDVIKKEHFEIATQKVLMGNSITSIKEIQRINFLDIFEKINGVEEILKKDPANVYEKMDYKTKEYYRGKIKEISKKTKISEIYIARKMLELAQENLQETTKKNHIGYYLIDNGINKLYEKLEYTNKKEKTPQAKTKIYITTIGILTIILSAILSYILNLKIRSTGLAVISFILFLIPSSEVIIQIIQTILSKTVKPKLIPKMDFSNGIDEDSTTMVVIPTIIKSKEKVAEMFKNLEVYYLANKSPNLYFTLLGDCSESNMQEEKFDIEVIQEGLKQVERLNKKYQNQDFPIFNFIYRKREWNEKEGSYLGWERKRGMLNQLNQYFLQEKNPFRINTIQNQIENQDIEKNKDNEYQNTGNEIIKEKLKNIKYIITLDADTDLVLNTASELVGAMAHILNRPKIDEQKNIVIDGYGIMQPRVGINLDISYKTLFTKIFAGAGGIDSYTNAISDIYQDNFKEGIFTGKGIYDLRVFAKVMENAIPENTVLSHDLLEGSYLRCGLVSDIMLMDGYPTKYMSFMNRLSRWIRGDWQITKWLSKKSPLNMLSKYKIFDNLRRSLFEISIIFVLIYINIIGKIFDIDVFAFNFIIILISIIPFILELINYLFGKREGEEKQKTFTPKISGLKGIFARTIITLGCLPYKAYTSLKAIVKTMYRVKVTHKNLLEWTTSEEAEKIAKTDIISYYKNMAINIITGIVAFIIYGNSNNILALMLGVLWILTPAIMYCISKEKTEKEAVELLTQKEQDYVLEIGKKTWGFFEKYLRQEDNFLIPDNYQEDRKNKVVRRTSSTNIGLSMMAVISANDLGFINNDKTIELLKNILNTVNELQKWNGHLYNWYNTETKEPLFPRYVSTVDSGNFVGYLYVIKNWLESQNKCDESQFKKQIKCDNNQNKSDIDLISQLLEIVNKLIENTDFSHLYKKEQRIFSIGFNVEENKLTNSYYDLLASEARQASLIAIAKKDVPAKHWNSLSRTLTTLGKYKGLVSWSGTSFEYLMPNINIPKYKGSLLDESCKFMIMSQMEYAKKLQIPWGISEAAFNLKDLHSNYQYKAFGIPWLGLKRGLADEMVVAPYGSILAITDYPKEVYQNLKRLEEYGMYNKYGFYESIDFTPERLKKGSKSATVKTYMAHHQGLILLSINNLFNNNILQKRFMQNPEINAISILLQETMPETAIITKENKEKVEKLKYVDYEDYIQDTYKKIDERLIRGNVIANEDYLIAMNQKGEGASKYKNILINRFKSTDDYPQGIFFDIKNIKSKKIWSSKYIPNNGKYQISFMPDKMEQELINDNIKTKIETIIAPDEPVEIRKVSLENLGNEDEILEITSHFEPVLSPKEQDYAHPAFNNLFLIFDFDNETNSIIVKRRTRYEHEKEVYMAVNLSTNSEIIGDLEYEIDEEKFTGRENIGIPQMVKNSSPFSKKIGLVTEPVVALKRAMKVKKQEKSTVNLIIAVGETKEKVIENIKKYTVEENIKKAFELSKAKNEAQTRYLRIKGSQIRDYQKMLSYIIFNNPSKKLNLEKLPKQKYSQSELWKYGISGDLPIILVKIKDSNDTYVVKEVLKAYEFMRTKGFETELVIIDEEKYSYENYVMEDIEEAVLNSQLSYLKNIRGGIFELNKNEISKEDMNLLQFIAGIIIDSKKGGISHSLKDIEEEYLEKYKKIPNEPENIIIEPENQENIDILQNTENLKYYNEYGAFSADGKEYLIKANKDNQLPTVWSHIMANKKFGTLVTQSMGGYTWYKNSRLNRVTAWENQPNFDIPSEIIYLKDQETKKVWSLGLNPMPDNKNYNVVYGFGYTKFIHKSDGIEQELEVFVPKEDSVKIQILKLKNMNLNRKKLKIVYYMKPVLGEDELKSNGYIDLKYDKNNNIICAQNLYNSEFKNDVIYVSNSEKMQSYTGDKNFFFGNGNISNPDGLKKSSLNNENSLGKKPCIAYEIEVELDSLSEKEIVFLLGAEDAVIDSKNIAYKYSKIQNCKQELENVKSYWRDILGRLQVYTPLESMNIILNGWDIYQTLQSRLLSRTGYYQSGGAYGFRDQLQDTLALKYIDPQILKNQILKHSKQQFLEGDVEHWWHEETGRGIRTKFSDDLLWLVYLTAEYIEFTGDYSILEEQTSYLIGKKLDENEDERYDKFESAKETGSIYEHCIKAIERSLNFGENGLPKIGSGDWNDGFSNVGPKGKGESVWLGFFLYNVLDRFTKIMENAPNKDGLEEEQKDENNNLNEENNNQNKENIESKIEKYKTIMQQLKKSLNTNGWDGRWFKRAFMDDGNTLGSMENDECRIDSIAQSWSTISNAGDNDKKYISMESLENHLIDRENGIIKLLDPPFEKGKLNPGYIKSYLPGVRENGGQYTHAAVWVIIAESMLGFGDKATELYRMINPIEHARTKESCKKYKVEPYVIPADIYGAGNLAGRGGWTWYTGSASWYYKTGIENILGLKIKDGFVRIEPCITSSWKEYNIKYKWKNAFYNIVVKNLNGKNTGVKEVMVNGEELGDIKEIKLEDNGVFNVEVLM